MNTEQKPALSPLLTKPPGREILRLALPMVWGLLAVITFNLVDTWFIARLGTIELAAISFSFPVAMFMGSLAMGLGTGAGSVIARAIGEKNQGKVQTLTTDSLLLSVLIVCLFVAVGIATIDPLFTLLGAGPETLPRIRSYMEIWYWGMPFLVIPMVGNSAIRAAGNTRIPSLIMIVAGGINIILDPILIFGLLGFPALGMAGAAIATVIARATTLVASLWFLHSKLSMLDVGLPPRSRLRRSWPEILHVGLPAAGANLIVPISAGMITAMIAVYGEESIAAFGIASRLEAIALVPMMALASAIGPVAGQNWGAGQVEPIRSAVKAGYVFNLIWGIAITIVFLFFAEPLIRLFNAQPEVIKVASLYLFIVPASWSLQGWIMLTSSAFNAVGKPWPATALTVTRMLVLYIPLALLLKEYRQTAGIFGAAAISNLIAGLIAVVMAHKIIKANDVLHNAQ